MNFLQKNLLLTAVMGSVLSVIFLPMTWWYYPLFYFISYPWTFRGHINSLWGGASENGVGSVFGIYQEAGGDAVCILSLFGVQRSGRDAVQGGGICFFQEAGDCAHFGIGLLVRQRSGYFSRQLFGVAFEQHSERDVKLHLGLVWKQRAREKFRGWGIAILREKQTASQ